MIPPPRANPDLVGHDAVEAQLLGLALSQRLPGALLLSGPSGIGKATLAFRLARFLLAGLDRQEDDGFFAPVVPESLAVDPQAPSFRLIVAGAHPDLLVIERPTDEASGRQKAEIPVDSARQAAPFLRRTAAEGGWRVVVIDGADALNRHGQNAILKILEEPPARALLILTADNAGRLLPTIRSRSRKIALSPLPASTLDRFLTGAAELPPDEAQSLARLAEGSPGRALALRAENALPGLTSLIGWLSADRPDRAALLALAETAGKAGDGAGLPGLFHWWLGQAIRRSLSGRAGIEWLPGEGRAIARLMARGPNPALELHERLGRLIAAADGLQLDRRLVLLSALEPVASAA